MAAAADTAAHDQAMRVSIDQVAAFLQDLLGQRLTAVMARQRDPKAVGDWARGARKPYPEAQQRLRVAYQVASLLLQREAPETVRAWFVGMNPHLADRAPAMVVADGESIEVMQAARAFIAGAGS